MENTCSSSDGALRSRVTPKFQGRGRQAPPLDPTPLPLFSVFLGERVDAVRLVVPNERAYGFPKRLSWEG